MLVGAAILWSISGALIKPLYQSGAGLHGVTIAFYRSLCAGFVLLPFACGKFHTLHRATGDGARQPASAPLSRAPSARTPVVRFNVLLLRPAATSCVVFFTLMTVCYVVAMTQTEAANAILLQYTSTFWIFALSPWLLGVKPRSGEVWLLALAMLGIAVIFTGNWTASLFGLLVALCSGLFFGLETLMIRRLRDADSAAVMVLMMFGSALLLSPFIWLVPDHVVSAREWLLLVALGVVQFGLPYYLYARALVRVPAHHAGLITLLEPILVPIWTYLAVREKVSWTTAVGGGMILLALVLLLRAAQRRRSAIGHTKTS